MLSYRASTHRRLFAYSRVFYTYNFGKTYAVSVEAGEVTTVITWANAYDEKLLSTGGCDPYGCTAELTRDSDLSPSSRWSCKYAVDNAPCVIWYEFGDALHVEQIEMGFYKGDERTRAFSVTTFNANDDTEVTYDFTSSGETLGYDVFVLNASEAVSKLYVTPTDPNYYDWLSITEVSKRHSRSMIYIKVLSIREAFSRFMCRRFKTLTGNST